MVGPAAAPGGENRPALYRSFNVTRRQDLSHCAGLISSRGNWALKKVSNRAALALAVAAEPENATDPEVRMQTNSATSIARAVFCSTRTMDGRFGATGRAPQSNSHHLRHQTKRELVDQKELGLDHERATHRQHLLLTAGQ